MPIQRCNQGGKVGYKAGEEGTCYTYTAGDAASRARAKAKAERQLRAIKSSQGQK